MKNKLGTIAFVSIICLAMTVALLQYRKEQEDNTFYYEYESVISREDENTYDITKEYYENYDDSGLETYIITGIFNEKIKYIKEVREADICNYVFVNDDGMIEIKVSLAQKMEWLESVQRNIQEILGKETERYGFAFNEEYSRLEVKLSQQADMQAFMSDITVLIYNAEIYQIFSGKDDWSVHLIVENMENGKELVNVQYPQEGWEITPEMWNE